MIEYYIACGIASFIVSFVITKMSIPRLEWANIIGGDENKIGSPKVAEMGGIAVVAGLSAGLMLAIFFDSFFGLEMNLIGILAAIITIHAMAFIGVVDDLLSMPLWLKAILPIFAAVPLMAIKAGTTTMHIPFIGLVDFGIVYIILLIPIGIAVCSNLTNMLAGFNGMESGMGIVIFATITLIAVNHGSIEMAMIAISILGALIAFMFFNIYPARIFPGDVGTLTIGGALASSVILGNFESAGAILMIPYVLDFFVKAKNGFPHTHQELRNGKLYPKEGKVKGFVHVVMKIFGGITEQNLVLFFIGLECLFSIVTLVLYLKS